MSRRTRNAWNKIWLAPAVLTVIASCATAPIQPGAWLMQSPDGTVEAIDVRAVSSTSYYLSAPGNPVAGVYRYEKGRLAITKPDNPRMEGLVWELGEDGRLVLIQESPVQISGRRLVSATLTKQP